MNEKTVIHVENLGIRYRMPTEAISGTKDFAIRAVKGQLKIKEYWALRNISFDVEQGSSIGIMGRNGAGKSTLLKAIARVLKPKEGRLIIRGNVFPLLELGGAFMPELTGHENVYLYGNVLGLKDQEVSKLFDEIVDFSELGNFINTPVRSYSTGMTARLAFAVATAVQPDILLADEILSVGDKKFQNKCMIRMKNYLSNGTTIVFVSHQADTVKEICKFGLWLERGEQKLYGTAEEIANAYAAS